MEQLKIPFGQRAFLCPTGWRQKGFKNPGVHSCVVPDGRYRMEEMHRQARRAAVTSNLVSTYRESWSQKLRLQSTWVVTCPLPSPWIDKEGRLHEGWLQEAFLNILSLLWPPLFPPTTTFTLCPLTLGFHWLPGRKRFYHSQPCLHPSSYLECCPL